MRPVPRRVLNISKHDAIGRRFNNLDAGPRLAEFGWQTQHCCWSEARSPDGASVRVGNAANRILTRMLGEVAGITGNLNGYYRNAGFIKALPQYKEADLLHFHIVHEKWLSLHDLRSLAREKPVVWTWHDPYMMTGHCVYPMDCKGYETGCQTCPHLNYHFPIEEDRAGLNLREKLEAVREIDPLVIVASDYMKDMVARSVYGDSLRLKVVPFGVEFSKPPEPAEAKARLGIDPASVVFGFRAVWSEYKGTTLILDAFKELATWFDLPPITVIAFQEQGACESFQDRFHVIETGWIEDNAIQNYYAAMDYFLMPSKAEAFGLMAIEAMAAGACPIVTQGTALPELIKAPVHGISVEHSLQAVRDAIVAGIRDADKRRAARDQRIKFANEAYGIGKFCKELAAAYDEEAEHRACHRRAA